MNIEVSRELSGFRELRFPISNPKLIAFPGYLNVPLKHCGSLRECKHVNKEVRVWPQGETNGGNKWLFRAELTTLLFVARPLLTWDRQKNRRVERFTELDSATLLWISFAVRFFFRLPLLWREMYEAKQVLYGRQWRIDGVLCTTRFPPLEEKFRYQTNISMRSIFIDGPGISHLATLVLDTCRYVGKT